MDSKLKNKIKDYIIITILIILVVLNTVFFNDVLCIIEFTLLFILFIFIGFLSDNTKFHTPVITNIFKGLLISYTVIGFLGVIFSILSFFKVTIINSSKLEKPLIISVTYMAIQLGILGCLIIYYISCKSQLEQYDYELNARELEDN